MQTKTHRAIIQLKKIGFPMPNIRKGLHKLTGISQVKIANEVGLTRMSITKYMEGHRRDPGVKEKIARIFNVPVKVLFPEDNEPKIYR